MSFSTLGLAPGLLRAVAAQGYTEPTPVQRASIPFVLAGVGMGGALRPLRAPLLVDA